MNTFQIISIILTGFASASPIARGNNGDVLYSGASRDTGDLSAQNKDLYSNVNTDKKPEESDEFKNESPIKQKQYSPDLTSYNDLSKDAGKNIGPGNYGNANLEETNEIGNGDVYSKDGDSYKQTEQDNESSQLVQLLMEAEELSKEAHLQIPNAVNEMPNYSPQIKDEDLKDNLAVDYNTPHQKDTNDSIQKEENKETKPIIPGSIKEESYSKKDKNGEPGYLPSF